jgi:2-iminobutanoate/2-iminopropanoate deaminase
MLTATGKETPVSQAFQLISTAAAPAAVGPYSQALALGDLVFSSGQIALDPASGALRGATAAEQTEQVMANLAAVLQAAGSSLGSLLKTTIFLTDMAAFQEVNEVYARALGVHRPARSTVQVAALPKGALVEIEGIALRVR